MFKIHRHRSNSFGDRIEFKFSHFHALQIPKGWDKLFISVVNGETGKAVAKSSKAVVNNGSCRWIETLSDSICIPQDGGSKHLDECLYKIVVSMGSARSGILGEVILNLADYITSRDSGPLSLPLKKCSYGTILQLKVQCIASRMKSRDGKAWKETASRLEDSSSYNDDLDSKSDGSDSTLHRSMGSNSSNHLGSTSYPDEPGHMEANFSASGSHRSSDSGESIVGKTIFSPSNSLNGVLYNVIGRQDSTGSHNSAAYGAGAGDDLPRSNHSSFSSKALGISLPANQLQENASQTSPHGIDLLNPSRSPKDLLEAAVETIDELCDEAKMWERHAQKLKVELEVLKKESADKSKYQADLNMELSAVYTEHDSLRQELEQLKILLKESVGKQTAAETPKIKDRVRVQKELEDELKFQKETNANLSRQLKKTQESNIELVSILQELEETIEKQTKEIADLSQQNKVMESEGSMRSRALVDTEVDLAEKLSDGEQGITNSEKLSDGQNNQHLGDLAIDGDHSDLMKEIEGLQAKVQELERDCAELTDENLELILKLKESEKDVNERNGSLTSASSGIQELKSPDSSDSESRLLKFQVHQQEEIEKKDILTENLAEYSKMPRLLSEMNKQLHLALTYYKNMSHDGNSDMSGECVSDIDTGAVNITDVVSERELADRVMNNLLELNDLLRTNIKEDRTMFQSMNMRIKHGDAIFINDHNKDSSIGSEGSKSEIEKLKAACLLQEEEIHALRYSTEELENLLSSIQKEKAKVEENLDIALRESHSSSKCLDDVRHDLMVLTSSVDSHVSANKVLERKSMELESAKHELELHISHLEKENVQLSERISGLEAQLRYLTDEKESSRLKIEDSRALIMDLKDEIEKHQIDMETRKVESKQKVQETQKRLSEAQEESEFLKRSHSKLQATVESLIEECSSLQKVNGDLRKQKLELHEHSSRLEVELSELQKKISDHSKTVEFLEIKLASLHKDFASKEKSLILEVENLFQQQKEHEEKIRETQCMLNQIDLEKKIEVENLEREVAHLNVQVSSTQDEREKIATDILHEASSLRTDKAKLENSLQEANAKVKLYESEIQNLRQDSGNKVQGLVDLLSASKQSEEMLIADIAHMQRVMEDVKSSEGNFKKMVNELDLKLRASDFEKQQIAEETASLKAQLQKITHLQEEITVLKSSLHESKFEKGKLEELVKSVSEECEELKTERMALTEKVSNMQKTLQEGEDDRRNRIALEEKLLRLECDLSARDASYAHEAEVKNELHRSKRTNSEYQRKIHCLQEEKDELMKRAQLLEKELALNREHNRDEKASVEGDKVPGDPVNVGKEVDLKSKIPLHEGALSEAVQTNNKPDIQLKSSEKQNDETDGLEKILPESDTSNNQSGRISSLESELKDMRERYLQMSLQYAEVEAQREELVMKVKSMKKEKRWFS